MKDKPWGCSQRVLIFHRSWVLLPPLQNIADLASRGWEAEIGYNDQNDDGNLSYGINLTLANNENEITKFNNASGIIGRNYVGRNVNEIWGYVTDGYYTADDFVDGTLNEELSGTGRQLKDGVVKIEGAPTPYPGDVKYRDLDGDWLITDGNNTIAYQYDENGDLVPNTGPGDRKIIGDGTIKYQYGVNGFINYKNLIFLSY